MDSTGRNTRTKAHGKFQDHGGFLNLYKKPAHVWLQAKEFDDVRGKTMERILREIREDSERVFWTGAKPRDSSQKGGLSGEDLDSANRKTEAMTMDDFMNRYKKPHHLLIQSKEFDHVRGKTRKQVLSEVREEIKGLFKPDPKPKRPSRKGKAQGSKTKGS